MRPAQRELGRCVHSPSAVHPEKEGPEFFLPHHWAGGQASGVEHFQEMVVAHHQQVDLTKGAHTQGVNHSEVARESPVEIVPGTDSSLPSDAPYSNL